MDHVENSQKQRDRNYDVTLFLLLLMMDDDGGYVVWNIPYHRFFTIKKQVSYWLCFPICEGFGHK